MQGIRKSGGAAATRKGQYKKRGRCRSENWSVEKAGALPQRDMGSIKSGGAAATRDGQHKKRGAAARRSGQQKIHGAAGQYKKRGHCRNKKWAV